MDDKIVIIALIVFIFFFIMREVNCWYLKINERLEIEKTNSKLLQAILSELIAAKKNSSEIPKSCKHLGESGRFCTQCGDKI